MNCGLLNNHQTGAAYERARCRSVQDGHTLAHLLLATVRLCTQALRWIIQSTKGFSFCKESSFKTLRAEARDEVPLIVFPLPRSHVLQHMLFNWNTVEHAVLRCQTRAVTHVAHDLVCIQTHAKALVTVTQRRSLHLSLPPYRPSLVLTHKHVHTQSFLVPLSWSLVFSSVHSLSWCMENPHTARLLSRSRRKNGFRERERQREREREREREEVWNT